MFTDLELTPAEERLLLFLRQIQPHETAEVKQENQGVLKVTLRSTVVEFFPIAPPPGGTM